MRWLAHTAYFGIVIWLSLFAANAADEKDVGRLQSAFVYNFMLFAQWPEAKADKPRILCIAGQNREAMALNNLQSRKINDKNITVIDLTSDKELTQCDTLFVASTEFAHLFDSAMGKHILVLTNILPDNGRRAGIVMSTVGGRVVFDVDQGALKQSNLYLGASVLRLARSVKE